ncbi:winged helix-turn-helix domain-containing protein [Halosolutus gelatinilyticus]|uniref:winged helix-turn-helix domain-containing protein n=1 Tax=Halosolutus gelatinilyticus TaxID=2931975 RepID=UPI001FF3103F|nr:winged helix-turn-helix domain-containing protein [Halosolutus gelatinilyticus]
MSDEWDVLVCSTCKTPWIRPVDEWTEHGQWRAQTTVNCPHCGAQYTPSKVKYLKSLPTREAAAEWRSRYLAKRAGEAQLYNDFTLDCGQYSEQAAEVDRQIDSFVTDVDKMDLKPVESDRYETYAESVFEHNRSRFETLAEYRLEQFRKQFTEWSDWTGETVPLDEQLKAYYGEANGDDDRTLTDPEPPKPRPAPEFDVQSLALRPTPPAQQRLNTITADVPPAVSSWLPGVLEALLPAVVEAVRDVASDDDPSAVASRLVSEFDLADQRSGFASVLATYACQYHDVDLANADLLEDNRKLHEQVREWSRSALTNIGTGRNALGLSHDDLAATIVPVLRGADVNPELVVRFDGEMWLESDHASTRRKTLTALEQLAMAAEVTIVTSPRVARKLESSHLEFVDRVTEMDMPGRRQAASDDPANTADPTAIYATLEAMNKRAGKLQILKHLERNPGATVKDIANDPELDLSRGSVRPYIQALESDHGFVDVDTRGTENTMGLSDRGEVAASLITDDLRVVHPGQETVFATFVESDGEESESESGGVTETPSQSASTVYGTGDESGVGEGGCTAEEALAATGDAARDGYVQWLPKLNGSSWPLHARITAATARDGVNMNDYPVQRWDDGRVTYVSCMDDHLAVSTQYGGPIPTLVRLATALLDDKLWGKVLTPSAVGDELEGCFGDNLSARETFDHLVRAAQVGWLSGDEREYDRFRGRYVAVRSILLEKLGKLGDLEPDERQDLMRRAHGLLMSATAIYDALGIDISIELRIPEPNNLNESEFCRFVSEVVTRQSSYNGHSLHRNFWEPDSHKRKTAKGFETDPSNPSGHLRASWVLSGPKISDLSERLRRAIAARDDQRLDDRTDYRPVELEVPVTTTGDYVAMRHAVETVLEKKNLTPARESNAMRRTVRLFEAYTGSTFDVVDALTTLARSNRPGDVTIGDIEHALGTLSADRLLPDVRAPTPGKILKVVLEADDPIGRSEILDRVGCSGETYRKHIDRLEAVELLERVDGRKWTATIAPWYVPETDASKDAGASVTIGSSTVDSVLYDALDRLGYDLGDPALIDAFGQPLDRATLIATVGAWIDDWIDVLVPLLKPKPCAAQRFEHDVVTIGEKPDQTTLADATGIVTAD